MVYVQQLHPNRQCGRQAQVYCLIGIMVNFKVVKLLLFIR